MACLFQLRLNDRPTYRADIFGIRLALDTEVPIFQLRSERELSMNGVLVSDIFLFDLVITAAYEAEKCTHDYLGRLLAFLWATVDLQQVAH